MFKSHGFNACLASAVLTLATVSNVAAAEKSIPLRVGPVTIATARISTDADAKRVGDQIRLRYQLNASLTAAGQTIERMRVTLFTVKMKPNDLLDVAQQRLGRFFEFGARLVSQVDTVEIELHGTIRFKGRTFPIRIARETVAVD